ncbi:MAG: phage baseplate protein, partial [Thermoanaerobaculia bacterium]
VTLDARAFRTIEAAEFVDVGLVRARLPNSNDVAIAMRAEDPRRTLLERCIEGEVALTDELADAIEAAMEDADPRADLRLALSCPACAHEWTSALDVVSFFSTEIRAAATRLVQDVHTLASAYGWREADILAMTPYRRELYLNLVTA